MSEDKPGFLSRWSRRKLDAQHELPLAEPASTTPPAPAEVFSRPIAADTTEPPIAGTEEPVATPVTAAPSGHKPLPTLDDVAALTTDSDFSMFVGKGVTPEVKNAAMKKLFSDPHYNTMDGLDIYIDDYSQPEVMPQSMLRKMVGARVLNLFTDEDEAKAVAEDERIAALATPAETGPKDTDANLPATAQPTIADDGDAAIAAPETSISDAAPITADPAAPGALPDDRPVRSMLESVDSLDQSAQRDLLSVPIKPGS